MDAGLIVMVAFIAVRAGAHGFRDLFADGVSSSRSLSRRRSPRPSGAIKGLCRAPAPAIAAKLHRHRLLAWIPEQPDIHLDTMKVSAEQAGRADRGTNCTPPACSARPPAHAAGVSAAS